MAVSYDDVKRVANMKQRLNDRALDELGRLLKDKTSILDKTLSVLDRYGVMSQEIGAQWYEDASAKAGVDVPRATVNRIDLDRYAPRIEDYIAEWELGELSDEELEHALGEYVTEELTSLSRDVMFDNMRANEYADWRISGQQARVRYARIPVAETCAWCIMLASLGPWYLSYESAGGYDPDRFHAHCDCEVVPYTTLDDIDGYGDTLNAYRDMYYDARDALESGNFSDEFKARMDEAERKHNERYEAGEAPRRWRWDVNGITMMMREQYGLT